MLIVTKVDIYEEIEKNNDDVVVYNLSSIKEGYDRLDILPGGNIVDGSEKEFDIQYAEYLLNNDLIFLKMFKPIFELYEGKDVFLLVSDNEELEDITESLTKFIQQRYGYDTLYLYDVIDIDDYYDNKTEFGFSIQGLYNLDIDKERYTELQLTIQNK